MQRDPYRVLFVCSGNICRSPLGEAIFRHQARESGLEARFAIDSAGTHGFHEGEPADPRARRVGERRGVAVTSRARPVVAADFASFDLILAMDRGHLRELRGRIRLMREWGDPPGGDVPDPYYDGEEAFEQVFDMLETCCRRLLDEIK